MEDILASIRRILNEDDAGGSGAGAAAPSAPPGGEAEPLALTEEMLVEAPSPGHGVTDTGPAASRVVPRPPAPAPMEAPAMDESAPRADAPPPAAAATDRPELVAPQAAAAAAAAVGSLLRAVAAERSAAIARGGPTLEDVVREEIRPLLKAWLDQHLPPLVERLVRAEIERVVGRALS
jgi:cell pole-organizing protein PopZ